jgi:hypothetical protein
LQLQLQLAWLTTQESNLTEDWLPTQESNLTEDWLLHHHVGA